MLTRYVLYRFLYHTVPLSPFMLENILLYNVLLSTLELYNIALSTQSVLVVPVYCDWNG